MPDQPPLAVQAVAPVEDQVKTLLPPAVIEVGLAVKVTVGGAAVTVIVADCDEVPPEFVQDNVKVLVAVGVAGSEPLVALLPVHAPEAVQVVAPVADQVNVLLPPLTMELGFALMVMAGAATVADTFTVVDCEAVPPRPVQVRV